MWKEEVRDDSLGRVGVSERGEKGRKEVRRWG